MKPEDTIRRLAFIRHEVRGAQRDINGRPPINGLAVVRLQDAVEWTLLLLCEHANVAIKERAGFFDYLDDLSKARGPLAGECSDIDRRGPPHPAAAGGAAAKAGPRSCRERDAGIGQLLQYSRRMPRSAAQLH